MVTSIPYQQKISFLQVIRSQILLNIQKIIKNYLDLLQIFLNFLEKKLKNLIGLSSDHREKIEVFEDYTLVVVKEIHYEEGTNHLLVSTISIIVFENLILSFHTGVIEPIEKVYFLLI